MKTLASYGNPPSLGGEWLSARGPDADIVISSRVRLARNLRGHRFGTQSGPDERTAIEEEVRAGLSRVDFGEEPNYLLLDKAPRLEAELLVERHLISKELARAEGARGVCWLPGEGTSVMVEEEDHLRVQVLRSGFQIGSAWSAADELDDRIARQLEYAWTTRLGYLTCCPTNVGTGMRASVMLHLPALVYSKHIEKVFQAGAKMQLAVRGLYGEGTQPSSDFFQISNQTCLGKTETDLADGLLRVVPQFLEYERRMREALLKGDRPGIEDRCWRAWGLLRTARRLTTEESLEALSALRLGVHLAVLPAALTIDLVNELFLLCQPAHLQRFVTGPLDPAKRDVERATLVRGKLDTLDRPLP